MSSNFEGLQKIIKQAYAENFSCLFHVETREKSVKIMVLFEETFVNFISKQSLLHNVSFFEVLNRFLVNLLKSCW